MTVFNKISRYCAPFLALMILLSSMSYSIDFHYCQGQLKSFSVFGKAKSCHEMSSKMASCHHHKEKASEEKSCSEGDKNCCNNNTVFFESDDDEKISNIDFLNIDSDLSVVALKCSSFDDLFGDVKEIVPFAHYKPPLIQKDLPVLFESFLI